jgi:hypothetical protein
MEICGACKKEFDTKRLCTDHQLSNCPVLQISDTICPYCKKEYKTHGRVMKNFETCKMKYKFLYEELLMESSKEYFNK